MPVTRRDRLADRRGFHCLGRSLADDEAGRGARAGLAHDLGDDWESRLHETSLCPENWNSTPGPAAFERRRIRRQCGADFGQILGQVLDLPQRYERFAAAGQPVHPRRPALLSRGSAPHAQRVGHTQWGRSSPSTSVSPNCFSSLISRTSLAPLSSGRVPAHARPRRSAIASPLVRSAESGATRSGCRLASGSFRTIKAGGRGDKSAAISSRFAPCRRKAPAPFNGREIPCWRVSISK